MKVDYFTIPEIKVSYSDNVKPSERAVIKCSRDIANIMAVALEDCMQQHEEMYVLFLNRANRVLGITCVSKGGLSETIVDIIIILQIALKASASALVISHNHPSGATRPSQQDITITEKLKKGCQMIGIQLLDHVIMTEESYTSFADEGLL